LPRLRTSSIGLAEIDLTVGFCSEVKNEFVKVITTYQLKLKTMEQNMEGMRQKLKLLGALPSNSAPIAPQPIQPSPSDSVLAGNYSSHNYSGLNLPLTKLSSSTSAIGQSPSPRNPEPTEQASNEPTKLPAPGIYDVRFSSVAATTVGSPDEPTESEDSTSPSKPSRPGPAASASELMRFRSATLRPSTKSATSIANKVRHFPAEFFF